MAVQIWTSTAGGFESTPAGDDSPADGDDRIRELKETLGDMLDKEHLFQDQGSTAAQGWHREGSALAYYQSAEPSNRPDGATALSSADDGRLWVDSDDGKLYVYTGSAWDAITAGTTVTDQLASLTAAEVQQLQNIGASTISAAQWGYVGAMNQSVVSTGSVTFEDVTTTDDVVVGDDLTVSGVITGQRVGTQTSYASSSDEDALYDLLKPLVPNNGDKCPLAGAVYQSSLFVVAYVQNISDVLYLRGVNSTGAGSITLTNGSGTTTKWALSW